MAKKMGRHKIEIDFNMLENLCGIQCTQEEIVSVLGVTVETINARCREIHGLTFSEFMKEKKGKGKASLRRAQWKSALAGDKTLLIWLGKQELGQVDKQESNISLTINSWDALEKEVAKEKKDGA